jgi:hypothetical protein
MAPSKKFALVFLLVAAAATGVPELVFKSGAGSMSIKYDGVSLDVPGYSRTTEVAALAERVDAMGTALATLTAEVAQLVTINNANAGKVGKIDQLESKMNAVAHHAHNHGHSCGLVVHPAWAKCWVS